MKMIESDEEINYLIGKIDPFFLNSMTYSDIVQLLSSHMVIDTNSLRDYDHEPISIPLLEKYSNSEFTNEQTPIHFNNHSQPQQVFDLSDRQVDMHQEVHQIPSPENYFRKHGEPRAGGSGARSRSDNQY